MYHKVQPASRHFNSWNLRSERAIPFGGRMDLRDLGLGPTSLRVRVGRNVKQFPLPGGMHRQDRIALEGLMEKAFSGIWPAGRYVSLTPGHDKVISQIDHQRLANRHIMFKDMSSDPYLVSAGIASDWPYGRGCYISSDEQVVIWVGEEDHLRIICMKPNSTDLTEVFERLSDTVRLMDAAVEFAYSPTYGVITSCPTNIGTAMRASVHLKLPKLTHGGSDAKAKQILEPMDISLRGVGGEHTPVGVDGTVDISPSARFCITEAAIMAALYNGIVKVMTEEDRSQIDQRRYGM